MNTKFKYEMHEQVRFRTLNQQEIERLDKFVNRNGQRVYDWVMKAQGSSRWFEISERRSFTEPFSYDVIGNASGYVWPEWCLYSKDEDGRNTKINMQPLFEQKRF